MNRMAGTGLARADIVGADKEARANDCSLPIHNEKSQVSASKIPARACPPAHGPSDGGSRARRARRADSQGQTWDCHSWRLRAMRSGPRRAQPERAKPLRRSQAGRRHRGKTQYRPAVEHAEHPVGQLPPRKLTAQTHTLRHRIEDRGGTAIQRPGGGGVQRPCPFGRLFEVTAEHRAHEIAGAVDLRRTPLCLGAEYCDQHRLPDQHVPCPHRGMGGPAWPGARRKRGVNHAGIAACRVEGRRGRIQTMKPIARHQRLKLLRKVRETRRERSTHAAHLSTARNG